MYKEGAQVCLLTKDPQRIFKDVVKEKKIDSVGKASFSLIRLLRVCLLIIEWLAGDWNLEAQGKIQAI